jgi:hypothetical protein
MCWTPNDLGLISSDAVGNIFEWNLFGIIKDTKQKETIQRVHEFMQKGINFTSVLITQNQSSIYAVGNDKMIKEFDMGKNTSQDPYNMDTAATIGQIVLTSSQRALIAGLAEPERPGSIRIYK